MQIAFFTNILVAWSDIKAYFIDAEKSSMVLNLIIVYIEKNQAQGLVIISMKKV